jgi:hypothetical protein
MKKTAAPRVDRHWRTRPCDRRRLCARPVLPLAANRALAIHAAHSGLRRAGRIGPARCVYLRRRGGHQIRLRAPRLIPAAARSNSPQRRASRILSRRSHSKRPSLIVIDSIQTMWTDLIEATPGTTAGARRGAGTDRFAKTTGAAVILVGHATGWPNRRSPRRRAYG